jgi:hypothetical protein
MNTCSFLQITAMTDASRACQSADPGGSVSGATTSQDNKAALSSVRWNSNEVYLAWFEAAQKQHIKEAERLLRMHKGKLDVNEVDSNVPKRTALGWACYHNNAEFVSVLVRAGCDINKHSSMPDERPLLFACSHGHTDCARVLLDAGADLHDAIQWSTLHGAAYFGQLSSVQLLLERGAKQQDRG